MTTRLTASTLICLAALAAAPASAQDMRPGLWELNNKISAQSGPLGQQLSALQRQIAAMSPEQRQMIEGMINKHTGGHAPTLKDGGMQVKVCVTKEMVAQGQLPMQQTGNCTNQRSPLVGRDVKVSFTCTNPESSGEGKATFLSDRAFTMNMNVRANINGNSETSALSGQGAWLGADCGSVKPAVMPASGQPQ